MKRNLIDQGYAKALVNSCSLDLATRVRSQDRRVRATKEMIRVPHSPRLTEEIPSMKMRMEARTNLNERTVAETSISPDAKPPALEPQSPGKTLLAEEAMILTVDSPQLAETNPCERCQQAAREGLSVRSCVKMLRIPCTGCSKQMLNDLS